MTPALPTSHVDGAALDISWRQCRLIGSSATTCSTPELLSEERTLAAARRAHRPRKVRRADAADPQRSTRRCRRRSSPRCCSAQNLPVEKGRTGRRVPASAVQVGVAGWLRGCVRKLPRPHPPPANSPRQGTRREHGLGGIRRRSAWQRAAAFDLSNGRLSRRRRPRRSRVTPEHKVTTRFVSVPDCSRPGACRAGTYLSVHQRGSERSAHRHRRRRGVNGRVQKDWGLHLIGATGDGEPSRSGARAAKAY